VGSSVGVELEGVEVGLNEGKLVGVNVGMLVVGEFEGDCEGRVVGD
jgi:hypothetical protein